MDTRAPGARRPDSRLRHIFQQSARILQQLDDLADEGAGPRDLPCAAAAPRQPAARRPGIARRPALGRSGRRPQRSHQRPIVPSLLARVMASGDYAPRPRACGKPPTSVYNEGGESASHAFLAAVPLLEGRVRVERRPLRARSAGNVARRCSVARRHASSSSQPGFSCRTFTRRAS